jgi:hypothetical protein
MMMRRDSADPDWFERPGTGNVSHADKKRSHAAEELRSLAVTGPKAEGWSANLSL